MTLKNILALSRFVQLAISASTPNSDRLTAFSPLALVPRSNGLPPAEAANSPQARPIKTSSDDSKPAANSLPAQIFVEAALAPKSVDGPPAPGVITSKVANEVVTTNTTSDESTGGKDSSVQKTLRNSPTAPKASQSTGTTTVVTNKVSNEVLTKHTAPDESAARGSSFGRAAGTPAETIKAVQTNASTGESTMPSIAPQAYPLSAEEAPVATSKGTDASGKAPILSDASTLKESASDTARSTRDTVSKSVDVGPSKSTEASTSDGPHPEGCHKVAEISTSSTPASEDASLKKAQAQTRKPATDDKSDPETSSDRSPAASSADASSESSAASNTTPKKTKSHSVKPMKDLFHDNDDSANVDPKMQEEAKPKDSEVISLNAPPSIESPATRAKENSGLSLYLQSRDGLIASSILTSVCVLIA